MIVERIKDTHAPFYRPPLPEEESAGVHPDILTLMKQCWAEEPSQRPSFDEVAKALKMINKGKSVLLLQTRDALFIEIENSFGIDECSVIILVQKTLNNAVRSASSFCHTVAVIPRIHFIIKFNYW